jgi:hypothetical protein
MRLNICRIAHFDQMVNVVDHLEFVGVDRTVTRWRAGR